MADGRVLAAGGQTNKSGGFLGSAEVFDPTTSKFGPAGNLTTARSYQTATALTNGPVLIIGGDDGSGNLSSAELFG